MAGYAIKKGQTAVDNATTEKKDYSKVIKTLKSGSAFKVRVPSAEEVVEVYIHSVYETFYSTPNTPDNLYDKAVELLYADAKAIEEEDEAKAKLLRDHAYALKAKPRYLMGFINLADGTPMIIDLSKKQANGVITSIKKNEKRLGQLAFEISKTGTGQSTTVGFNPIMFLEEDLEPKEFENFNKAEGVAIDEDVYANCLYVKNEDEQADDVIAFELKVRKDKKNPMELNLEKRLGIVPSKVEEPELPNEEPEPIEDGEAVEGEEGYGF